VSVAGSDLEGVEFDLWELRYRHPAKMLSGNSLSKFVWKVLTSLEAVAEMQSRSDLNLRLIICEYI